MDFLPMPHRVTALKGHYHLPDGAVIMLENTEPGALLYAGMLKDDILRHTGLAARVLRGRPELGDIVLGIDASLPSDRYRLIVAESGIRLSAGGDEALLHGVVTLGQWLCRHGAILPAIDIEDYPDLPNRGYYLDCSRGRVPTLDALKSYADLLCRYKINQWQLYIEHTYLFRHLSEAWCGDTPLEAEEIMELDAYCRARHIELVPSLSSFGHMYEVLSSRSFEELCELEGSVERPFSYLDVMRHHTINVSHPGAMDFVKALITEYRALFTSDKFNICCDETFDLGRGRSAELAQKKGGAHALYVEYVSALCDWLIAQGITPMIWGDILVHDPASYATIPKGTVCLNWGYLPDQRENEIRDLAQMGATQYACPGVCTWNYLIPLFDNAFCNNRAMCAHAHRYKAVGLLNTDWGDFAHICHPWFSIPGILYGAAFAWNAEPLPFEEVNEAVSLFAYGDKSGRFMKAFSDLSLRETFTWHNAVSYFQEDIEDRRGDIFAHSTLGEVEEAEKAVNTALHALDSAVSGLDPDKRPIVHDIHLAAEGVKIWNRVGLYVCEAAEGRRPEPENGFLLAERLENWYQSFQTSRRLVSKESNARHLTELILRYAALLRDTHKARRKQ